MAVRVLQDRTLHVATYTTALTLVGFYFFRGVKRSLATRPNSPVAEVVQQSGSGWSPAGAEAAFKPLICTLS